MGDDGSAAAGADLGWRFSTAVVLFHEAVAARLGLSAADHKALGIIAGSGAVTAGQLADRTGLSPAAVTGLIDRLEGAGLVCRARDPADRRRVIVEPVGDQRADTAGVFAELSAAMEQVMARYDTRELLVIRDYVERTIVVLEEQTRRLSQR